MPDFDQDIKRLQQMTDAFVGHESINTHIRLVDFLNYYLFKFIANVKSTFSDFSHSELELFNKRHASQIELILKDPLLNIKGVIVPIPKGMVKSYLETVEGLVEILANVSASTLQSDLESIMQAIITNSNVIAKPKYSLNDYNRDKQKLGNLYSMSPIAFLTAETALGSVNNAYKTNEILKSLVKDYYPEVLYLAKDVDLYYNKTNNLTIDDERVKLALLSIAYRISLFSITMDHVQKMEHNFVNCLALLRQLSLRKR